jgi:hypothetical protein
VPRDRPTSPWPARRSTYLIEPSFGSWPRCSQQFAQQQGETSLLLIGAAARDLLLVHAHGVDPERATEDTDVALAVDGWDDFQRLREALLRSGQFTADGPPIVSGVESNAWTSFLLAVWNARKARRSQRTFSTSIGERPAPCQGCWRIALTGNS